MKILNKSQVNTFLQCPYKWKKIYVEKIRSKPSIYQMRGTKMHKQIETFYQHKKKPEETEEIGKFLEFEKKRIKDMMETKKIDHKYFYPLFQELKLSNPEIGLKGTMDAVFINPKDDGIIVLDWKTGKYYGDNLDSYRFELAVYSELLNHSDITDEKVKYIAIYFVDQDILFFEELKQETIDKMYKTVQNVREGMENEICEPKKNTWCFNCQFKKQCSMV